MVLVAFLVHGSLLMVHGSIIGAKVQKLTKFPKLRKFNRWA